MTMMSFQYILQSWRRESRGILPYTQGNVVLGCGRKEVVCVCVWRGAGVGGGGGGGGVSKTLQR